MKYVTDCIKEGLAERQEKKKQLEDKGDAEESAPKSEKKATAKAKE